MPLETQKIAAVNFDVCHACLGVWIPNQAIKGIVAARAMTSPQFLVRLLDRITKVEQTAYTDALTGIRNRRFFDRQLYAEIARARGSHYLSLVLMDIDGFKHANDTHGHATGDLVLKHFGEILIEIIRKNDCAARVGGDEFGIILPETDSDGARAIAERIIEETAAYAFTTVDEKPIKHRIQVSAGIAAYPADFAGAETTARADPGTDRELPGDREIPGVREVPADEIESLQMQIFDLADAALYAAKEKGKGRAVSAGELSEEERNRHIVVKEK